SADLISASTVCGFFEVVPSVALSLFSVNIFLQKDSVIIFSGYFCKASYNKLTLDSLPQIWYYSLSKA
ncbi:hypothetical protein, partial [Phascolarctobacterium succinatutens]|uniref:hypothetical protein n=1 Tax=Phascolarctobacterium succinatutens TaxID=626940 RepID=UPI0026EFA609